MSRWDDNSEDVLSRDEELRLLKKFQDYRELEQIEIKKRKSQEAPKKTKSGKWSNRFFFASIIQGGVIAAIAILLIIRQEFF